MMRKYYFINKFDTNNIDKQDKQTIIVYRDYVSRSKDQRLILKIKNYCKKKSIKFYLSNNIKLAIKLDLDGAYIPSFNRDTDHLSFSLTQNFTIIGSAHNKKEVIIKNHQNCKLIFLAPLFKTIKSKNNLNISRYNLITLDEKKKFISNQGLSI